MADVNGSVPAVRQTDIDANTGWMGDVQRVLALLLIGTVSFMVITLTIRIVISGDLPTIAALLKELKDALTNMSLIALGFFFGNTMAKMSQDKGQQATIEKLTSPPPLGPLAPVPSPTAPTVIVSWWSLLDDTEKAAIKASTDSKIKLVLAALESGKAEKPDLDALVDAGLLTQDRANKINPPPPKP